MRNKYVIVLAAFGFWFLFFDRYNMLDRLRMHSEIRQREEDREYFLEEIARDSLRLHELTTDRDNLEKFAREQYLMKKPEEDVFVVITED